MVDKEAILRTLPITGLYYAGKDAAAVAQQRQLEIQKAIQEAKAKAIEAMPVSQIYGFPSKMEEDTRLNQLIQGDQPRQVDYNTKLASLFDSSKRPEDQITAANQQFGPRPMPNFQPDARRESYMKENPNINPDAPLSVNKDMAAIRQSDALYGIRKADPKVRTVAEALPGVGIEQLKEIYGPWITPQTTMATANQVRGMQIRSQKAGALFPVAGLSPEAQSAAQRAGLGSLVTESQARILNQGNLPRPATEQEVKDSADSSVIQGQINEIKQLAEKTNYKGIGVENYYINKLGQYSPIDALATDPEIVRMYQLINEVNNKIIYLLSGKQINEQEFGRLKATFPEPELNQSAFATRLNGFESEFNNMAVARRSGIQGAGRTLTGRGGGPQPAGSPQQEQMVTVISPEGVEGQIPASKVPAAQKRGFKIGPK